MSRLLIVIPLLICFCTSPDREGSVIETHRGIAERSKGGLVVGGVMVMGLSDEVVEKYKGKNVEVTGEVIRDHPWNTENREGAIKQGFTMPAMVNVQRIKLLN